LASKDFDGSHDHTSWIELEVSPTASTKVLHVYPSLATSTDMITVDVQGDAETLYPVTILDRTGQVVAQKMIAGKSQIRLSDLASNLSPGIYHIHIIGTQNTAIPFVIAK
jgi:hypothetical protein